MTSKHPDPFFETFGNVEWNACIGSQGYAENYVDGYIEAALVLVKTVIDKQLVGSRDTLAMPILYNCRHGLELSLKYAIDHLYKTGMLKQGHPQNHDIMSLWNHLSTAAVGQVGALGDKSLRQFVADLEPYVRSLAAIDDDGQELRYAQNRSGQSSLSTYALVDLIHIHSSINALSVLLKQLKSRVHEISEERDTKSHTSNCSRKDLEEIAKIMGNHSTWREPDFYEKKTQVRELFGLSSGKFSDAIEIIKKSRSLAVLVGLETRLNYLTNDKAIEVLKLWHKTHQLNTSEDDLGFDYFNRDWSKFFEYQKRAKELDETVFKMLSMEEFADLETLFYLGRDRVFGEHYERRLEHTIALYQSKFELENVHHIMSKTNLLVAVIEGVEQAGCPSLASKLRKLNLADEST